MTTPCVWYLRPKVNNLPGFPSEAQQAVDLHVAFPGQLKYRIYVQTIYITTSRMTLADLAESLFTNVGIQISIVTSWRCSGEFYVEVIVTSWR